jgi:hypothetical protein
MEWCKLNVMWIVDMWTFEEERKRTIEEWRERERERERVCIMRRRGKGK